MVRALFCLIPSGIMSRMSCITAARSSRSKWDSTRCLVTVLATPFEWRPGKKGGKQIPWVVTPWTFREATGSPQDNRKALSFSRIQA